MRLFYKGLIPAIVLLHIGLHTKANGPTLFTQFLNQQLAINPAEAGTLNESVVTGMHKQQFTSTPGAANSQMVSFHTPFPKKNIGLGLWVSRSELFITNQNSGFISYAYHIPMEAGNLSMGLHAGFSQYNFNFSDLDLRDPNDPAFANDFNSKALLNFGIGVKFASRNFFSGLSIPQLINHSLEDEGINSEYLEQRKAVLYGGVMLETGPQLTLLPTMMLSLDEGQPLTFMVAVMADFNNQIQTGVHYKKGGVWSLSLGYLINEQLRFGYAYDFGQGSTGYDANGHHEISVRYAISLPRQSLQRKKPVPAAAFF